MRTYPIFQMRKFSSSEYPLWTGILHKCLLTLLGQKQLEYIPRFNGSWSLGTLGWLSFGSSVYWVLVFVFYHIPKNTAIKDCNLSNSQEIRRVIRVLRVSQEGNVLDFSMMTLIDELHNLSPTISFIKVFCSSWKTTLFLFGVFLSLPPFMLVITVCVFAKLVYHSPCVKSVVVGFFWVLFSGS